MAGSPVWGKAFHEGLVQGRLEGAVASAALFGLSGAVAGGVVVARKLRARKLAKKELLRSENVGYGDSGENIDIGPE